MHFHSSLSKLRIGKSPFAISHSHYTGKTLAKFQIKLFANILWSQAHFTIKRAAETPLPWVGSNESQFHQSYALSPDLPQGFNPASLSWRTTIGSKSQRHYKVLTGGGGEEQLSIPYLHRSLLLKSQYNTSGGKSTSLGLYSENVCRLMDQKCGKYWRFSIKTLKSCQRCQNQ